MVRQAFFAMMSAQIIPDLEQVYGFIPVAQYPSQMNILQAEWGSVSNLRFLVSSLGSLTPQASALGNTVYNVFVTGQESRKLALYKFFLIDMEALEGDMGQAKAA